MWWNGIEWKEDWRRERRRTTPTFISNSPSVQRTLDVIIIIMFFFNLEECGKPSQRRVVSDVNNRMKHEVGGWCERVTGLFRGIWIDDVLWGRTLFLSLSQYFLLYSALRWLKAWRMSSSATGLGGGWGSSFRFLRVSCLYRTWCRIRIRSRYISSQRHVCVHCLSYNCG